MNYCVYVHLRADSGNVFYVGKGTVRRVSQKSNRNPHWHRIVKKHGMRAETVVSGISEEDALDFEKHMIAEFRIRGLSLCNMTDGGDGISGYKHTEASRNLMSESRRGLPSPTKGKTLSPEHRKKLRIAKLGKPQSASHIEASRKARIGITVSKETRQKISSALTGKRLHPDTIEKLSRKVLCITTGVLYKSLKEAGAATGAYPSNISKCCKGILNKTAGFRFSYYQQQALTA